MVLRAIITNPLIDNNASMDLSGHDTAPVEVEDEFGDNYWS